MGKTRSKFRIVWILAGLAAMGAAGVVLYRLATRDTIPALQVADIQEGSRVAARAERTHGQAYFRPALPTDESPGALASPLPSPIAGRAPEGWETLAPGASIKLGTLVRAEAKSGVELSTSGQWYMGFDGEGAMVFQDARRNAEGTEHTLSIYVQQGLFRAKVASGEGKGYYLDITTAAARIHVFEGEIGVEVGPQGKGRMWLVSGRATALWNDGRRKELRLKGLEDL